MLQLFSQMNSVWERRANANIICSAVYLLRVMFFEDIIMCEELVFVETNHRQTPLMRVAVVMGGEGPLCACECLCGSLY